MKTAERLLRSGLSLCLAMAILLSAAGVAAETVPGTGETPAPEAATSAYDAPAYATYHAAEGFGLTGDTVALSLGEATALRGATVEAEYAGKTGPVLRTEADSSVTFQFTVPADGCYRLLVEYYPLEGSTRGMQREITVDGGLSFAEAACVEFPRVFVDTPYATEADEDEVRPQQTGSPRWLTSYCRDTLGYYGDLYWNLTAGTHTLTLRSLCEPMVIGGLTFCSSEDAVPDYKTYLQNAKNDGAAEVSGKLTDGVLKLQAEDMLEKSSQTLYASNDKNSPATEPFDIDTAKLNMVGGTKWGTADQWISWELTAPETGLYRLGSRFRQNTARGVQVHRELSIDGAVPFKEAGALTFTYHNDWQVACFGDGEQDYLFYLTAGETHTLTMRVVLSDLADILSEAQLVLADLNTANWGLMTVLGTEPDANRDYELDETMPEVIELLRQSAQRLNAVADRLVASTGQSDSNTAVIRQFVMQLEGMVEKPQKIASNYKGFKDNIGALGDSILNMRAQPLALDYLLVAEADAALPKANAGFFATLKYHVDLFIKSFLEDYALVGAEASDSDQEPVVVWIGSGVTGGRDQAQALNRMIKEDFLPRHDVPVQLQLTAAGTILVATLAGMGPDVALQIGGSDPVDYAMRHAVYDMTQFADFEEVAARFTESALTPFRYNGGVYALPETQSFYVMFYRKDILSRMGISVDELTTWDGLVNVLGDLQENNLSVALPANYITYFMFLNQMGGALYKDGDRKSALDEEASIQAFKLWTNFYVNYQLPVEYSFVNRFRLGEMPIGIEDYTNYNLLSVSAPEIAGLWDIAPLPGVEQPDGTINNTSPSSASGAIIMATCENTEGAWEFLKWWTGADIQKEFGTELESIMGAAARYNTANVEAADSLPWSVSDLKTLRAQRDASEGIPQVPGGYYTTRYIEFAMRLVVNNNESQRDTLLKYVPTINEEIAMRREEFGLD